MTDSVRVRYAPSPTGYPHIGNIRTALFNWLFARHHGGSFIVRIEDTDVTRNVEGAIETILDGLCWLSLDWDEGPEVGGEFGPYLQSQRLELYSAAAQRLVSQGNAYYCYCSPQQLEAMRAEQARLKQPPGYNRRCRNLCPEDRARYESEGITPVVRFKTPLSGQTSFNDLIRQQVTFDHSTINDFVLLKSDGYPTYHLASVVDDHLMKISHVLRAEEWLSSTPHHLLLYRDLGFDPPQFAHLPMILGPDRAKLSKRHGAASITEYREQGYLPEAMFNFMALLGWSLDDKTEIMSRQQLMDNFSLDRVSQTAAIFNREKLNWMNGVYIRTLTPDEFTQHALPFLDSGLSDEVKRPLSVDHIKQIMPLVQDRARTLAEIPELTEFFFLDKLDYPTNLLISKNINPTSILRSLQIARERLKPLRTFDAEALESILRPLAGELRLETSQLFGTLRIAVTGRTAAPPLFQTMAVLGKEQCLKRIEAAIDRFPT